jgi:thioredoxin-like negative regulator of GroEL
MKFSSPICQACRMLKQKFQQLHRSQDPRFVIAPVVFADIVLSNNKKVYDPFRHYVTSQLQVERIPSIYFYVNGGDTPVDKFCCDLGTGGCSWPTIQQQMLQSIDQWTTKVTGDDGTTQHYEVLRKATTTTATLHKDSDDGNVEKAAIKDYNGVLISPTTNIAALAGTATMNTAITAAPTVTKEKSKKAPKSIRKRIQNLLLRKITRHIYTDDDNNNKVE